MVIASIEPERFVFVDECSSNISLARLYGWARRGERAHQRVPRNWGKNITLVSSIGKAIRTISDSDAESFFEHCGYRAVVQSL